MSRSDVDAFLAELRNPLARGVAALRAAIVASDPAIRERIKWNAPSFGLGDDDRVTLRLPPKGGLQLVFHRGAKPKDTKGFAFEDPSGLLVWAAADRGVVTLRDLDEIRAKTDAIVALVGAWMRATR